MSEKLTRRSFLNRATWVGVAALGSLLSACTRVVKETVIVSGTPQVVEKIVEKQVAVPAPKAVPTVETVFWGWVTQELPVDNMVRQYNEEHADKVKIEVVRSVEGWKQKAVAAARAGNATWNTAQNTPWMETRAFSQMQLIQPFDDFLEASTIPWAQGIMDDMLDTVRPQMVFEGKITGMPMDMDDTCFGIQIPYCEAVGVTETPKTWEDVTLAAREIRGKFKDEGVYGICSSEWLWIYDGPGAIFYNVSKKPFTDEGIFDVTSDEFIWALQLCKQWQDEELAPSMASSPLDLWKKNKIGMCVEAGAFVFWGQKIWGKDTIADPFALPRYEGGGGAAAETMGYCLLQGAPYPQEAVDFMVWLFGPGNTEMQSAICSTAKTPAYKSTYENIVKPSEDWQWMLRVLEMFEWSIPLPHTASYDIQYSATSTWMEKYFTGQETNPRVAMENCLKEINDQLAKMTS